MREIKFRAWDKEKKQWAPLNMDVWGEWQGASMSQNYPKDEPDQFQLVNDDTYVWMQYTGLKDKNGKEIYEGDVVRTADGYPAQVSYDENHAEFDPFGSHDGAEWGTGVEVVGNIYENPDLLTT